MAGNGVGSERRPKFERRGGVPGLWYRGKRGLHKEPHVGCADAKRRKNSRPLARMSHDDIDTISNLLFFFSHASCAS